MNLLARIVAHKLFALSALLGVGIWLLVIPGVYRALGANPLKNSCTRPAKSPSGPSARYWRSPRCAFSFRVQPWSPRSTATAAGSAWRLPLRPPSFRLPPPLRRLSDDVCAVFQNHSSGLDWPVSPPHHPRAHQQQWSVRKLGGKNWKRLHRLAYLAAALLIYHQSIAGKGHWHIARWLFFTLVTLELARLAKTFATKQRLADHRTSMTSN